MAHGLKEDRGVLAQERERVEKEGTQASSGHAKLVGRPSASTADNTKDLEYETDSDQSVDKGEGVLSSQPATMNNEVNQAEVVPSAVGILEKQRQSIEAKPEKGRAKARAKTSKAKAKKRK